MTSVQDIKAAIEQLAPEQRAAFRAWFEAFDARQGISKSSKTSPLGGWNGWLRRPLAIRLSGAAPIGEASRQASLQLRAQFTDRCIPALEAGGTLLHLVQPLEKQLALPLRSIKALGRFGELAPEQLHGQKLVIKAHLSQWQINSHQPSVSFTQ
jgi:hypothetical protein